MSNPLILFLDDSKDRTKKFRSYFPYALTAETAPEMIKLIQDNAEKGIDFIFLDHDLGGETYVDSNRPDTGMEVVRWLVANLTEVEGAVIVHTLNYDAGKRMVEALEEAGYLAQKVPFINLFSALGVT